MGGTVWAGEGGTRRSNAPSVRGTLQLPHGDNTTLVLGEGYPPQRAWTTQPTVCWQSHGEPIRMSLPTRRCLLAVFAHPDDETSAAAGTLMHYARAGVDIHVVTATRGERGDLGTGDLIIARQDLPPCARGNTLCSPSTGPTADPLDHRDQEPAPPTCR
jgi:hypothetical protein